MKSRVKPALKRYEKFRKKHDGLGAFAYPFDYDFLYFLSDGDFNKGCYNAACAGFMIGYKRGKADAEGKE